MQALALPNLLSQVKNNAGSVVFTFLVLFYHVLENKFPCSCEPQVEFCILYITAPCLIIIILMLSMDIPFQRAWRYTTTKCSCHFGIILFNRTVKASCVGLLWIVSVLIDAEWYVCCNNPNPRPVADFQCKNQKDITSTDMVMTIAEMKTNSRLYGLALLLGITVLGGLLLSSWTSLLKVKDILVHELILEVGDDVVSETMKEGQKQKITDKVNNLIKANDWAACLGVVDTVIKETKSKGPNQTQDNNQQREHHQSQDKSVEMTNISAPATQGQPAASNQQEEKEQSA